jgi:hypothetical protein
LEVKNQYSEEFSFILSQQKKDKSTPGESIQKPITIKTYSSRGVDLIPSVKVISQGNKSLVFVIDQTACHSYFNVPISGGKIIRIASMDTLITLYFSLGLLDTQFYNMGSMECLANKLVQVSIKARENPDDFIFPFISIKCSGHQTSLPSLIRAKVKRITQKKEEIKDLLVNKNPKSNIKKPMRRRSIKQNMRMFL